MDIPFYEPFLTLPEFFHFHSSNFCPNMDPYAIITCLTQEKRSSVASGKGTTPEWNETFLFTISDDVSELRIKIMDSDNLTQDDFVGEATIPLESLFHEGSIPPTSYNVTKDEQYCGEIRVGLTFTRQAIICVQFQAIICVQFLAFIIPFLHFNNMFGSTSISYSTNASQALVTLIGSADSTMGRHLARRLVQIGVTDIFSVPGDFNLTLGSISEKIVYLSNLPPQHVVQPPLSPTWLKLVDKFAPA
ncbi:hypothetical protein TEA_025910 [Camellia sinensis var. sinensis]|uniref:C2 domain-containing protein n=1 Tax=Camellia sinensis var. sinensis TaxID=542762 RepID=A0A4S4DFR1_CAMSN|nr:hypothetical protein TEA_025910 [Camellia sinensis var. sinensis]